MFKNVALGVIAASALAFAVSQIWVSYEYKKWAKLYGGIWELK